MDERFSFLIFYIRPKFILKHFAEKVFILKTNSNIRHWKKPSDKNTQDIGEA